MGWKSTSTASPANRIAEVGVSRMSFTEIASAPSCHSSLTTLRTSRSVRICPAVAGFGLARPGPAVGRRRGRLGQRHRQARAVDGHRAGLQLLVASAAPRGPSRGSRRAGRRAAVGQASAASVSSASPASCGRPHARDEVVVHLRRLRCAAMGVHVGHREQEADQQRSRSTTAGRVVPVPGWRPAVAPRGRGVARVARVHDEVDEQLRRVRARGGCGCWSRSSGRRAAVMDGLRTSPAACFRYTAPAHRYRPVPQIVNAHAIGRAMSDQRAASARRAAAAGRRRAGRTSQPCRGSAPAGGAYPWRRSTTSDSQDRSRPTRTTANHSGMMCRSTSPTSVARM